MSSSDRLDGIGEIARYMGVIRSTFYRVHYEGIKPYLLERELWQFTKIRSKWFTYKDLVKAYLSNVRTSWTQV